MRARMFALLDVLSFRSSSCSAHQPASVSFTPGPYCLPDTDFAGQWLLASARMCGLGKAPVFVRARELMLRIPLLDSSQIATVTDETKCARAARALDSAKIGPAGFPLHLVTMGTHYMAFGRGTNEEVHLDSSFTVRDRIVGQ